MTTQGPLPLPTEILLLSPRPGSDAAFHDLAARLEGPLAPVPVRVIHGGDRTEAPLPSPPRPGAALVTGGQPVALEVLASCPAWRWVHLTASGPDHLHGWPPLPGSPLVTYSRGVNARSIAEWALAAILHFYRDLDHYLEQGSRWDRRWARELSGARLLVVGAGAAGTEVARLAEALGLTTVGVSRTGAPRAGFHRMVSMAELDAELAQADVTLVLLPLSDLTRGTFDAERLGRLKEGSLLLVASRGGIVDEDATLAAVRAGRLRGAAFDVFAWEPLPDTSPLWEEPRILVTPHVAGTTDRFMEHTARILIGIWGAAFTRPTPARLAPYVYAMPGA
jgi:phosphoglycerate dehydrogenase-like enzyme